MFSVFLITLVYSQVRIYVNGNLVAVSGTGDGGHTFHDCIERIYVSKGDILTFTVHGGYMNTHNYIVEQLGLNNAMRFYYAK